MYTDDAMALAGGDWGISGVSLKSPTVRDQLAAQDGLYSVRTVSRGDAWRVVGSVREVLFAPEQLREVIARIARAETQIVSLTVTEKGYCANVGQREPLWDHPDIANDLAHADALVSVLGVLVAGLHERYRKRGTPLTVLCCDNLPKTAPCLRLWCTDSASDRIRRCCRGCATTCAFRRRWWIASCRRPGRRT